MYVYFLPYETTCASRIVNRIELCTHVCTSCDDEQEHKWYNIVENVY